MSPERQMVVMAVFEGKLPASHITEEELHELEETVFELVAEKRTVFETWETLQ